MVWKDDPDSDDASEFDISEYEEHFNLRDCPFCGKEVDLDSAEEEGGDPICPYCGKRIGD